MDKIVLDASIVLEWLAHGPAAEAALAIHNKIVEGKTVAWTSDFLLVEIVNILFWKKRFPKSDIDGFTSRLHDIGINFDNTPVPGEIHALSALVVEHRISAYDAQYLYVAQKLNCKLVSFDKDLLKIRDWVIAPS